MSGIQLPPITSVHTVQVGTVGVFYREAGPLDAPVIVLFHGFLSSSHQYRNLIPLLAANRYRVIAPDLPNFGFTTVPEDFVYQAPIIAKLIADFLDVLRIDTFSLYMTDYGVPIAMRLALTRPEKITAIVTQNGNIYQEGFSPYWDTIKSFWKDPENKETWTQIRDSLSTLEDAKGMYEIGSTDTSIIPPESYWHDYALLQRPGRAGIVVDMLLDHRHSVDMYPQFQAFIRDNKVPVLVLWGTRDFVFVPAGAEAYKRDAPDAQVKLLDAGHFLLETHLEEAAIDIITFLNKHI